MQKKGKIDQISLFWSTFRVKLTNSDQDKVSGVCRFRSILVEWRYVYQEFRHFYLNRSMSYMLFSFSESDLLVFFPSLSNSLSQVNIFIPQRSICYPKTCTEDITFRFSPIKCSAIVYYQYIRLVLLTAPVSLSKRFFIELHRVLRWFHQLLWGPASLKRKEIHEDIHGFIPSTDTP